MRSRKREAGSAMVELAMVISVMVPLFTGIFQFGYGFYSYNQVIAAVRSGARYASLLTYNSSTNVPSATFRTAVANMVVYGNQAGGTRPLAPGLSTNQVNITVNMSGGTPDTIKVSLNSWTLNTIFKNFTFVNKPSATFRYSGVYAP